MMNKAIKLLHKYKYGTPISLYIYQATSNVQKKEIMFQQMRYLRIYVWILRKAETYMTTKQEQQIVFLGKW